MRKSARIIGMIAAGIMLTATVTTTVFSVIVLTTVKESEQRDREREDAEKETEEDTENVLIGARYQILSTKNISDAYITGDSSELNDEDKKTLKIASDILDEIIKDDMTDYEKEEAIYLWMTENVKIDGSGTSVINEASGVVDRPFGVLQNKKAVCVGYATSFRLLTNMVGLDCMVMHDTSLSHSWDLVMLDDGCWYIVDCYFDSENGKYIHFNMNASLASQDHDWDESLYPIANGSKYCYAEMNKSVVKDAKDLMLQIYGTLQKGDNKGFYEINPDVINNEELDYLVNGITERLNTDSTYSNFRTYINNDKKYILLFDYVDYEDVDPGEPGNVDTDTLDSMLNDVFGEPSYEYNENYQPEMTEEYKDYPLEDIR